MNPRNPTRKGLPLLLAAAAVSAWCGGGPVRMPPVEVLDLSKPLVVKISSSPAGAQVFTLGPDGKPSDLLGETPVDWPVFEIEKDEWKFDPHSAFLKEHGGLQDETLTQYVRVEGKKGAYAMEEGRERCIDVLVTLTGYRPHRLIRCLKAEELPSLFKTGSLTLSVALVPEDGPSPRADTAPR